VIFTSDPRELLRHRPASDRNGGRLRLGTTAGFKSESPAGFVGIRKYAAEAYRKQLADMKATPSMSRTGCCYDNAPMESFFHTLKVELVHQRRWATRDEARRDLFAFIEGYYNRQRIHSALGYITPEQAERNAS
jgi:transposase InsO family protein